MIPDEHKYNPHHHHRRSIRLKGYDYSAAGAYFITICCHKKECHFGKIENGAMKLNDNGTIAYDEWNKLQKRFPYFELDVFQIMPNHIHAIVVLTDFPTKSAYVGAGLTPALPPKITQIQDDVATEFAPDLESRAGQAPPLRQLAILLVPTNHWWQRNV